jgi:protoporphyrinogen oxidase
VHIARERSANGEPEDARERCACGAVIATSPLAQTASLAAPEDRSLEAHAAALGHRGMRFVNVLLDGPGPILDATWMYIADPSYAMTRVQEPAERSASMTPPGRSSLMLELPADPGERAYTEPDGRLAARLLDELASLGIDVRPRVIDAFSTRAPFAYPRYALGYERHRDALLDAVRRAPNVWSVGRQGLFRYVFMDTAMEMGFAAARAFIDGRPSDVRAILEIDRNPTLHEVQSVLG